MRNLILAGMFAIYAAGATVVYTMPCPLSCADDMKIVAGQEQNISMPITSGAKKKGYCPKFLQSWLVT